LTVHSRSFRLRTASYLILCDLCGRIAVSLEEVHQHFM